MTPSSFTVRASTLLSMLSLSLAVPVAKEDIVGPPPICLPNIASYQTLSQSVVDGPVTLSSVSCLPESTGCSLSLSEAYSIGVSVTVGINLGVNTDTASAGLDASVSWTKSQVTTDTGNANCPAGAWTCGLAITPSVYQVDGHMTWSHPKNQCWNDKKDGDYTVQYPMKDSQNKPIVKVWACSCPDKLAWADAGAPPKCPSNCNGS